MSSLAWVNKRAALKDSQRHPPIGTGGRMHGFAVGPRPCLVSGRALSVHRPRPAPDLVGLVGFELPSQALGRTAPISAAIERCQTCYGGRADLQAVAPF